MRILALFLKDLIFSPAKYSLTQKFRSSRKSAYVTDEDVITKEIAEPLADLLPGEESLKIVTNFQKF